MITQDGCTILGVASTLLFFCSTIPNAIYDPANYWLTALIAAGAAGVTLFVLVWMVE